jgi:hypothetical protein
VGRWKGFGRIRNWFECDCSPFKATCVQGERGGPGNTNPYMAGGKYVASVGVVLESGVYPAAAYCCSLLSSSFLFVDQYEETLLTSAVRLSRPLAPAGCQRFFLPRRHSATQQHESKDTSTNTTKMTIHVMAMEATMSLGHFHSLSNG